MIPLAETKVVYLGDGETTVFPFTFKYADVNDIKVSIYDIENDAEEELTKDYYVDAALGAVIYPGYPPNEEVPEIERPRILDNAHRLVVFRNTEISQPVDLGEKYPLEILEKMHDRAILLMQELNEIIDRTVKVTAGSDKTPDEIITFIKDNAAAAEKSAAEAALSKEEAGEYATQAGSCIDEIAGYAEAAENSKNQTVGYAALVMGRAADIWKEDKNYNDSDVVVYHDGYIYQCVCYSPAGTIPSKSASWVKIKVALDDYFTLTDTGHLTLSECPTFSNAFTINQTGYVTLKEA